MTKTKTLNLLLASAALSAAVGLPAWSAMTVPSPGGFVSHLSEGLASAADENLLVLVDDDDDEDEGSSARYKSDDDDDDECDDDEGSCGAGAATAPKPAGSVPPPENGLFGTGTPQVQVK